MTTRRESIEQLLAVAGIAAVAVGSAKAAQPHMEAAENLLRQAEAELRKAVPDKGGHRAKAMDAVKVALEEVHAGIQFSREH